MQHTFHKTALYRVGLTTLFAVLLLTGLTSSASAQYVPLTGIPGVTDTGDLTLAGYINALFLLSIALGAMLAVIKIAIAGVKYMLTEVVTEKGDAVKDITGALLGLGILLAAVLVLTTIYPGLVNLNILSGAPAIPPSSTGNQSSQSQYESVPCDEMPDRILVLQSDDSYVCAERNPPESDPIYEGDAIPEVGGVVDSVTLQGYTVAEQTEIESLFRESCNTWGNAVGEGMYETTINNGVLICTRTQ